MSCQLFENGRTRVGAFCSITAAAMMSLLFSAGLSAAQTEEELTTFANKLPPEVLKIVSRSKGQYLQKAASQIFQYAPDGNLTKGVIDLAAQQKVAAHRASSLMSILAYDLNGDFQVSKDETDKLSHLMRPNIKAQFAVLFAAHDTDENGSLSQVEIVKFFEKDQRHNFNREQLDQYFAFDFNGDGRVDVAEISMVLNAISPDILETATKHRPSTKRKNRVKCTAPTVPNGHQVVLLSGHEGPAVSNVALNGPDNETSVATILVEDGDTPLYVFATSHDPIVWKFEGATDRVKNIVVQPRRNENGPGAAVHGINADAVTFVAPKSCVLQAVTRAGQDLNAVAKELSSKLSTAVSSPVAAYNLDHIQIPSGIAAKQQQASVVHPFRTPTEVSVGAVKFSLSAEGMVELNEDGTPRREMPKDRKTIRELMRFSPGGILSFELDELVTSKDAKYYDVLPSQAGLLQLIAQGKIEVTPDGKYRVMEQIAHYPGGLTGAHSVVFRFAKGVALPAGKPGHSTVFLEETNACVIGTRCK